MTRRTSRIALSGAIVAVAICAIDQFSKWWLLEVFDIASRHRVTVTPFFDLVLVWNRGISYGLLPQEGDVGRFALIAVICAGIAALCVWLVRCGSWRVAVALGAVIGGGVGNVIDRIVHGAVADFFRFHAYGYEWYVFNLADVAVVAGVAILLYDILVDFNRTREGGKKAG